MDKNERMNRLKEEALSLKDEICDPSVSLVWGEGSLDSALVIVGEAPAADENRIGRPFVGPVGRFLDRELEIAGIGRDRVYITNTLKCWPFTMTRTRKVNRSPSAKEIRAWSDVLLSELEIIHPSLILCLGNVPASVLIHQPFMMTKYRGIWFDGPFGSHIIATFHPGYVERFGGMREGHVITKFRHDLKEVTTELMKYDM